MDILLAGSVAFDYLMTFPGHFKDHILPDHLDSISLSFLVDSMVRLRGGVAPNIAYTLALLGERPRIWATVGEDFEEYRNWLESKGIDTSGARVIPGEFTASFFVNTDRSNSQIASFYPGAMAYADQLSIRELKDSPPDLLVISPTDPKAMNQYVRECQELSIPYIYDPSQQIVRLDEFELRKGIQGALALFLNTYEYALIQKITGLDAGAVLRNRSDGFVVVTGGEQGATIFTNSHTFQIPVVAPEKIVDPTGVGDAFRGGFLKGYIHGLEVDTCGRVGSLAATYCLEHQGPQGQDYNLDDFIARFKKVFNNKAEFDVLVKLKEEIL